MPSHMVHRAPVIPKQQETPTIIDIIKRHFLELMMAREGRKEKAEKIKENGYACFKMENKLLILCYMPDVLVEIFAGT